MASIQENTDLPVTEILMVTGFFLICAIEVALHSLLGAQAHGHSHDDYHDSKQQQQEKNGNVEVKIVYVKTEASDGIAVHKDESSQREEQMLSAMRTFFVVFALSFHAVMDGIALSLQDTASGVWISFGAISLHKLVIALSIGIELMSAGV